ncbi:MAG: serine/threonine protein kinase [Myxococcales bacterium]|nr:serine/threonine protein kinase [Myxococcales bacterium]
MPTDDKTKFFYALTPEHILHAVASGGLAPTGRMMQLNSYENRVYQIEVDDDRWVVGKFYRPGRWSLDTILDEHRFLQELAATEIPVAAPLTLSNGATIDEANGIMFSLYPRLAGRSAQELNDEQLRIAGRLLARIHNVGAQNTAAHRLHFSVDAYGRNNLDWLLSNQVIPPEAEAQFAQTVTSLLDRISPLFEGVPFHRIHGDCHLGNIMETARGLSFLDFDDMMNGPAVQDVWMLVPSYDAHGQAQRDTLLTAYREVRDFSAQWLRLIEPLRALRFLHYATWIARRFSDPAFQKTFSHFGTLSYWQNETQDLREQIARIDAEQQAQMLWH